MSKHLKDIKQRLEILSQNYSVQIHKDWVIAFIIELRQHLEAKTLKNKYPVLNFYCNWNMHPDLNNETVQNMLEKIDKVIMDPTKGHPSDRISEILSLSKFRLEVRELLKKYLGVRVGLFDIDNNWKTFSELMFLLILEKPLIKTREAKTEYYVESLELYDNNGKLYWKIRVSPGNMMFTGHLLRTD